MVFPLADDNRDRSSFPYVTIVLIVINVFVFFVLQGAGTNDSFTYAYSTVPREILTGKDLVTDDRLVTQDIPGQGPVEYRAPGLERTPGSVYLTLLTSMFMHGSIMHLLGNMWFLWIFGDNIEHDLKRGWYIAFYLVCGLLASLAHVFTNTTEPNSMIPSLGASGAISGVLGAYLVLHPHRRVTVLLFRFVTHVPGWVAVGIWFAFQVISSLVEGASNGIAYGAHIGGFVAGFAIAGAYRLMRTTPQEKLPPEDRWG